ncbi:DUF7847 domain-containing protein [Methanocella arvoryzae]|uniref:DUF7847 domain-containing protein n=1 Tax=Methanocella arvoryzae (strain DSM 22066 / NBRC 105507 / MRE50) TaxID=351160 RepID=Q0W7H0_METAR|nr:hypothetical protein [Methanocella arvoryzae]CAJ35673.1 hypothetical protein RCIX188 [Methanocella arvoryzae MRE50]
MDDFTSALRRGLSGTVKSPVLIVAGLLSGLVMAVTLIQYGPLNSVVNSTQPDLIETILVLGVSTVLPMFAMPFILGGALGCAVAQSTGGKASWGLFFETGRKHYLNMLMAGIAAWLVYYFLSLLMIVLIIMGSASPLFMFLLVLIGGAALFFGLMFIEFYDISIVAGKVDFIRSFGESIGFVRKHVAIVIPFFIIVVALKTLVQLPLLTAYLLKGISIIAANLTYYDNGTVNSTLLNETVNSTTAALQTISFSAPSLLAIMLLQGLVQSIVFAFLISCKAEFYQWAKNIKKITDFDYDFSADRQ